MERATRIELAKTSLEGWDLTVEEIPAKSGAPPRIETSRPPYKRGAGAYVGRRKWSRHPESNRGPRPYQGRALSLLSYSGEDGALEANRTPDLLFTRQLLSRLSYEGKNGAASERRSRHLRVGNAVLYQHELWPQWRRAQELNLATARV
jgi:hypothetical protein